LEEPGGEVPAKFVLFAGGRSSGAQVSSRKRLATRFKGSANSSALSRLSSIKR
jgi:hypothetical protein